MDNTLSRTEADSSPHPAAEGADVGGADVLEVHVVLLTNFVPPYRLPVFEALAERVARLTVLVSTPVESNRAWRPDSGRLDMRVQRTITVPRTWRHPSGFADPVPLHFPWDTFAQLRGLRPDVIISAEFGLRSLFSAVYRRRSSRAALVLWATLSERTEESRGRARRGLRRWLARRADRVIVNGASGRRYVERLGMPSARVDEIPQVALPSFADVASAQAQGFGIAHLVFVGQLTQRKGLDRFLPSLDEWARAHPTRALTLSIAGSGPQAAALESSPSPPNLEIRLVGEVEPSALPDLYAGADALVFPTLADEWGLVVNEALAAGVPVLGSIHSQAVVELCDEGATGWLFDPEDPTSARAAIERALATNDDELARMRELARARVRALTPEWAADRIAATIQRALSDVRR